MFPGKIDAIRNWINAGLSFLYPEVCQLCEAVRATSSEGYVCGDCCTKVQFIQPPFCDRCGLPYQGEIHGDFECSNCREMDLHFSTARSSVVASGIILGVIHRYKYSRALWFEPFLTDLLVRQAKPVLEKSKWDFIVPVPLHSLKQREREFNQAERLARGLSRATLIPMNCDLLQRINFTRTQTKLNRTQRMSNVQGAFRIKSRERLHGEKIILLDDVLTTGATTSACAKVLRKAGAGEICVWTVARGL